MPPEGPPVPRRATAARVLPLAIVAAGLFALHRHGALQVFADPSRLRQAVLELGPFGQAAFVGSFTALQPFGVPGTVFIMAAPLIWPWPVAFALSMIGTMGASVVGFSFARFVGRDLVAGRIPARVRRYEEALERRGFVTVAALRFVLWMPQWLHAFLGVSRVRFWTHFWGSVVGYAVPLWLVSYFGEQLFALLRELSTGAWLAIGAVTLALIALGWLYARRDGISRGAPPSSSGGSPAPPG